MYVSVSCLSIAILQRMFGTQAVHQRNSFNELSILGAELLNAHKMQRLSLLRARLLGSATPESSAPNTTPMSTPHAWTGISSIASQRSPSPVSPTRSGRFVAPVCPATLRVISTSSTSVVLQWSLPASKMPAGQRLRFNLFRDDTGHGIVTSPRCLVYDGCSTMHVDTGLTQRTTYAFMVSVLLDGVWSQTSAPLFLTTPPDVLFSLAEDAESESAASATASGAAGSDTDSHGPGSSAVASYMSAFLGSAGAPFEPAPASGVLSDLMACPGAPTFRIAFGRAVLVMWDRVARPHARYRLLRSLPGQLDVSAAVSTCVYDGPAALFRDTGLHPGHRYAYAVQAYADGGASAVSAPAVFACRE
jgi:hypothetical protein